MAKFVADEIMDVALNMIADIGDTLYACSDQPANWAAIAAISLGSVALTEGDGNGDYVVGDGDVSGRKLTLTAQEITASDTGNVTHLVIADDVAEAIAAITTCSSFGVTNGNPFDVASYTIWEIRDPS